MRVRQRHFNPRHRGAILVLDARYIAGLSDGAAVATWTDRSASANNAAQSNAGLRPTYKTGVSGGSPSVNFTPAGNNWNSGKSLQLGSTINHSTLDITIIAIGRCTSVRMIYLGRSQTTNSDFFGHNGTTGFLWRAANDAGLTGSFSYGTGFAVTEGTRTAAGSAELFANRVSIGTGTVSDITNRFDTVGARYSFGSSDGDVGHISVYQEVMPAPMRKRIAHSLSFGWKRPNN